MLFDLWRILTVNIRYNSKIEINKSSFSRKISRNCFSRSIHILKIKASWSWTLKYLLKKLNLSTKSKSISKNTYSEKNKIRKLFRWIKPEMRVWVNHQLVEALTNRQSWLKKAKLRGDTSSRQLKVTWMRILKSIDWKTCKESRHLTWLRKQSGVVSS